MPMQQLRMRLISNRYIIVANLENFPGTLAPPTTTTTDLSLGICGITCLNGSPYMVKWTIIGLSSSDDFDISLSSFIRLFS